MKMNDHTDPLDQKIDALLSNQAVQPSIDFTQRVLAATDEISEQERESKRTKPSVFIRFALPMAAALAVLLTFMAIQINKEDLTIAETVENIDADTADFQEIFLLEDGLSILAESDTDLSESDSLLDILNTLDALYLEVES
ncbi:MAG: hypothetical protein AAGH40_08375 [Verrucomicrobiota bacterium]